MNDAEMIEWLRDDQWAGLTSPKVAAGLAAVARRLEQLTRRAERSPLTPGREAEIRDRMRRGLHRSSGFGEADDLLAALDHERAARVFVECQMQDQQQESALFEAGVRAGVAQALQSLGTLAEEEDGAGDHEAGTLARYAAAYVKEGCGPAELPPHAQTHAECQRYRAALLEISQLSLPVGHSLGHSLAHPLHEVQRLARAALGEGS